jgi:hypothetical protein
MRDLDIRKVGLDIFKDSGLSQPARLCRSRNDLDICPGTNGKLELTAISGFRCVAQNERTHPKEALLLPHL